MAYCQHMEIGKVIKELREERNLTQQQLASALNVDKSTIAKYETGDRLPNIEMSVKLALFFNVTTDYLFGIEK